MGRVNQSRKQRAPVAPRNGDLSPQKIKIKITVVNVLGFFLNDLCRIANLAKLYVMVKRLTRALCDG